MPPQQTKLAAFEQKWLHRLIDPAEEQVLWMGRPSRLFLYDGSPQVLAFVILWYAMLLIAVHHMPTEKIWQPDWRAFFLVFVILWVSLEATIFPIWKWYKARHTVCVLTNKRAIIQAPRILGGPRHLIYPLHPAMLRERHVHENGSGSLIFDYGWHYAGDHRFYTWPIGFLHIPNVVQVEQLIHHEIIKQGGYTPQFWKEYKNDRTKRTGKILSVIGFCLLLGAGFSWALDDPPPTGWEQRHVNITYAPAQPEEKDGSFLMQATDGTVFRIPLPDTQGRYAEGENIRIIYPPQNPLQVRVAPWLSITKAFAFFLAVFGILLLAWGQIACWRVLIAGNPYDKILRGEEK